MKQVTAAIIKKDGVIFIAKRKATDKLANKWEFPGGKIELGETPEQCLAREIKEELNIDVEVGQHFNDSIYHYEHGVIQLMAYWAEWKGGQLIPRVHDDYKWVPVSDLINYDFAPADIPLVQKLRGDTGGI